MEHEYDTKGKHIIIDMWGINPFLLNNLPHLKNLGKIAIAKSGATFVDVVEKKFEPNGVTLLFLLEESHLSFHSYPSKGFLATCMFTCGDANPDIAIDYLIERLEPDPNRVYRQSIIRGVE